MAKQHDKNKSFKISIISPFYNEASIIDTYFSRVIGSLSLITDNFEIICIDDGSSDSTKTKLVTYYKKDKRVKVVSFSRNFGKECAMSAGLKAATGDAIIPLDADLQDPPELIGDMVKIWQEGYDVVLAQRKFRGESFFKKYTAYIYYYFLNLLTNGNMPINVGDFRLLDCKVVKVINLLPEKSRYMKGIFSWAGFKSQILKYDRPARMNGKSTQSIAKLWNLALDGIFSFSTAPLKIWTYVGLMISSFAFLYALFIIAKTLILGIDWPGYSSIMVAVLFMGGVNLFSLGILGEYVARIYKEVKNRPLYIIDESYGIETKTDHRKQKPKNNQPTSKQAKSKQARRTKVGERISS